MLGFVAFLLMGPPRHIVYVPISVPVRRQACGVAYTTYEWVEAARVVFWWDDYARIARLLWGF